VTPPPILSKHALETPGAQEAILEFNDLLRETVSRYPRAFVLDLHASIVVAGHRRFLSPWDSHLNQAGNDWLAQLALQEIAARTGYQADIASRKAA
jgi:hypothetical protein